MRKVYCTLVFHKLSTTKLDSFANNVLNGIYKNQNIFDSPVVAQDVLLKAILIYSATAADYKTYGITKKTDFATARKNLINYLDQLADYVDKVADGDVSKIVLSGFEHSAEAKKVTNALDKIKSFDLKRSETAGEIIVEIPVIQNHGIINYYAICTEKEYNFLIENNQIISDAFDFKLDISKSRKKSFKGLKFSTTYYFYVFASNPVSISPISDAKSIVAI